MGERVATQGLRAARMNGRCGTVVGVAAGASKFEVQIEHGRFLTLGSVNLAVPSSLALRGAEAVESPSAMHPFGRHSQWTQPPLWQLFEPQGAEALSVVCPESCDEDGSFDRDGGVLRCCQ